MMKVPPEIEHAIVRHHLVDEWPIGTIASTLRVHHDVVRRVLRQRLDGPKPTVSRARKIDNYLGFIEGLLRAYPMLHASRLFHMVKARGYDGSESHFRRLIAQMRPRRAPEPFARLSMPPAEQAQVDWAHFGTMEIGRARRPLVAFVMTLSWSRMVWLQFFHDMKMAAFLRGHVDAFGFFGGVPRKLLYDNLKSAVIERVGTAIRFNPQLLELGSHYGFEPVVAGVRRGNEKGRVERSIRYIRTSFFAARQFKDVDELNEQAVGWSLEISAQRRWPDDDRKRVAEQFAHEQTLLRPVPPNPFEAVERVRARVGRTPYVRFDTNDYSLPAAHVRTPVTVVATHQRVRVIVGDETVADHARSYDRKQVITAPGHHKELLETKRQARQHAATHRLTRSVPAAGLMLERAAQRGHNLGSVVAGLMFLLDSYGADAMASALEEANESDRVGPKPVRLILEKNARNTGAQPRLPVPIRDERLRNVVVKRPDLSAYDRLVDEPSDGDCANDNTNHKGNKQDDEES